LLALEVERLRREFEINPVRPALARGGPERRTSPNGAEPRASALKLLGEFLAVEPERARLLLYALGPPWEGVLSAARTPSGSDEEMPPPLAALPHERLLRAFEEAVRAPAWPAAEEMLKTSLGLTAEQVTAVRAQLCRRAVASAFESDEGVKSADEALAKYAELMRAQAETLLGMAGSLELVRAGVEAMPALEAMAKHRPELAAPLSEAVEENLTLYGIQGDRR
jgi:hypothetical protein